MKTITLNVPESVDLDDKEAALLLAVTLYEQGKISSGQGAEISGFTKRTFIELLGRYNVSLFDYDPSELERDIKNAATTIRHC